MYIKKHPHILILLAIIALLTLVSYFFKDFFEAFGVLGSRDYLQAFIEQLGVLAPLVYVSLIVVEVFIAPLPGEIFPIVGGIIFGPLLGITYSWIGNVLGSMLAFLFARRFGAQIVAFFVPSFLKKQDEYNKEINEHKNILWALYAIPIVPIDIASFALGISAVSLRHFTLAIMLTFFIRMTILNLFGDALAKIFFF